MEERSQRARSAWPRVLTYLGVAFVLATGAQILGLLVFLWLRDGPGSLETRMRIASASGDGDAILGAAAFAAPIVLLWTWCLCRLVDHRPLTSLGLSREGAFGLFRTGLSVGLLLPGVILLAGRLLGVYRLGEYPGLPILGFSRMGAGPSTLLCLLLFLVGFTLQAGVEELMVRGYVQTNLLEWERGRGRTFWTLVAPSILFALAHVANGSVTPLALFNTALAGFVLAVLVLRTGSLWASIGAHAGWNLGLAVLWSLPVSGLTTSHLLEVERVPQVAWKEMLFGAEYGPEGGIITTLLYLLILGLVLRIAQAPKLSSPVESHQ